LMRSPVASQTTEAGLGLSLMGQSGMGGGGGICATGTGSCFFNCLCARVLWGGACDFGVADAAAGGAGDCAAMGAPQRRVPVKNALASMAQDNRDEAEMRDCSAANVRMGISSLRPCGSRRDVFAPPHCIRLSVAVERS
jgi:hypothetical protein